MTDPHSTIVEAEERLRQAMLHSDVRVLDELIAPELIFTTHLGQLIGKADDLAFHRSGALKLTSLTASQQHILLQDRIGVVSVLMHLLGSYEGASLDQKIRYTRVWRLPAVGPARVVAGHASVLSPS
jgi:hypothetical protein